jgi:hypothetical protein
MIGRESFYLVLLALALALLTFGSLVWIGGEMHYRNYLQGAEMRYPVAYQPGPENQFADPRAHFAFYEKTLRDQAISACSRWP